MEVKTIEVNNKNCKYARNNFNARPLSSTPLTPSPKGKASFFDNFVKQNITSVLRDAEASSPTATLQ